MDDLAPGFTDSLVDLVDDWRWYVLTGGSWGIRILAQFLQAYPHISVGSFPDDKDVDPYAEGFDVVIQVGAW